MTTASLSKSNSHVPVPLLKLPRHRTRRIWPGLLLTAALAAAAMSLGQLTWLQSHGFSALTLAIVLGMLLGNTAYPWWPKLAEASGPGVQLAKQPLLRLGVVLFGLHLTLMDIGQVGWAGVLVDALVLSSTFTLAVLIGTRWLGLDRRSAMLIGAGSAICGAAAVMATEPVVRARPEQVTVAVATVVVFGTVSIFLYPLLFQLNLGLGWIPGGASGFGLYAGSTIHEVAQVVAAARSVGTEAANTAVIAKMVRVMMLAPFLLLLSLWLGRGQGSGRDRASDSDAKAKITVPWFAFAFVAMVGFNSLQWLPAQLHQAITVLDTGLLAMAMSALGLSTDFGAIRRAGVRPLWLASMLFVWLLVGGALINHGVVRWLGA